MCMVCMNKAESIRKVYAVNFSSTNDQPLVALSLAVLLRIRVLLQMFVKHP